jgi:1-phosphofructokinase family hexose kinase
VITFAAANPSIDKTFEVERLEPGRIHRPRAFVRAAGGKAINAARAALTLGAEVRVVVLAGGHAGRWLAEELEREGIEATIVAAAAETRSSLSVLDRSARLLTEFYEGGEGLGAGEWGEFERAVRERVASGGWLALSGSLPAGAPDDGYARLLEAGRADDVAGALDASGAALDAGVRGRPRLVKVNALEAADLLDAGVRSAPEAAAARRLATLGGGAAAITRGHGGATLCAPGEGSWSGPPPARGSYPVGSGDSFLAGLLVGRERGLEWPGALALALGASAAAAEVPTPTGFDRARAEELARRVEVDTIDP